MAPVGQSRQKLMSVAALLVLIAAGTREMSRPSSSGSDGSAAHRAPAPSAANLVAVLPAETAGCLTMHYEADRSAGVRRLRMQTVRAPVTDDAIELLLQYSLQVAVRAAPPPHSPPGASTSFCGEAPHVPPTIIFCPRQACSRNEPFSIIWDLRECGMPSTRHIWRSIRWGTAHKQTLDQRMTAMAVVLAPKDHALRGVVRFVLRACMPKARRWRGKNIGSRPSLFAAMHPSMVAINRSYRLPLFLADTGAESASYAACALLSLELARGQACTCPWWV
jgi:hypothetical protein